MTKKRIGFVGTRFAGTDGVSLETKKWADVLGMHGHECFYMAGKLDMPDGHAMLVPEFFFERLSAELVAGEMEVWRVTLKPAVASGSPLRFDGEVFIACDIGELSVEIGGQEHVLGVGDVAHFKATHPFTYRNDSDGPTRFLLVATLPAELRSVVEAHATSVART